MNELISLASCYLHVVL